MYDLVFNSVKEYPDMVKIALFKKPIMVYKGVKSKRKDKKDPQSSLSSISRTKTTLEDLCICNQFDLFCTFTFDPKRFDSKNLLSCRRYMNTWIRNAKERHSPDLKYLIVPELHESGAIHFHALIRGFNGDLRDSKHSARGRTVYNIKNWHFGFSTAVEIDNIVGVSRYIRKYITKDMLTLPGKKRYFCSQNLIRPTKETNKVIRWLHKVPSDKISFYASPDAQFYTVRKSDIPFDPKTASQPRLL